jgi:hypothetical protein
MQQGLHSRSRAQLEDSRFLCLRNVALVNSAANDLMHVEQIESVKHKILLWPFRPQSTSESNLVLVGVVAENG